MCDEEEKRFIEEEGGKLADEVLSILFRKKEIKSKPVINKLSEKIVKQVGHQPIYDRYEKIVEVKKKREREIEEEKRRQK